jgi:hypothetical protein
MPAERYHCLIAKRAATEDATHIPLFLPTDFSEFLDSSVREKHIL